MILDCSTICMITMSIVNGWIGDWGECGAAGIGGPMGSIGR